MSEHDVPEISPAGDGAVLVVFGEEISPELYGRVTALASAFEHDSLRGIRELVMSYSALMIHYDPLVLSYQQMEDLVMERVGRNGAVDLAEPRLRVLPTVYGGCYGVDLPDIARHLGLPEEEVIRMFSETTFIIYMLGHTPGNPYFGGLPPRLAMPRLERPREHVPRGTVGLAHQATVYPFNSPGGWRWVGRTPIPLFDRSADPPNYLQAGDHVQFPAITEVEYLRLGGERCR